MEGLLVAVHPLDILLQAFAVVEHLPALLGLARPLITLITALITAVLITAASCSASICLGCASLALRGRLGSFESDGGGIVEEG